MGEKKNESDVGLVFLIMLIVGLVLAVMGTTFYIIHLKKENKELSEKQNQVQTSQAVINYQVSADDEIEEENDEVIETEIEEDEDLLDDVTAKSIIQNYLKLMAIREGSYDSFIKALGLVDSVDIDYEDIIKTDSKPISKILYKTNIKYDDFKNIMLTYISLNLFEVNYSMSFAESNGYLYYEAGVGASGYTVEIGNISLKSKDNGKYVYNVERIMPDGTDFMIVTIVEENGNYVIDNYDFVN